MPMTLPSLLMTNILQKILFEIIEKFKKLSGLEINREKTYGMWLGSDKNSKQRPFGVKWPGKPIKTLGVYFSADAGENVKINFDEKIEKLKSKLNIWTRSDYLRPLVHCQHARVEPIYISGIACSISRKCYQNYRTACL